MAVNPVTNKVYVANAGWNTVTVIDGASNGITTVPASLNPGAVAVNSVTNKVYVANEASNDVTVIDGATNGTTTIPTGTRPIAIAANTVTNKVYVVNNGSNDVTVIDGTVTVQDLIVTKKYNGPVFTRTFGWTIEKSADYDEINTAGSATFNYTVKVTKDAGTDSDWSVYGMTYVYNPNSFDVTGVDITEATSGATCSQNDWPSVTIPAGGQVRVRYRCRFTSNPGTAADTATVTWPDIGSPNTSATFTADYTFGDPTDLVNDQIDVADSNGGTWHFTDSGSVTYPVRYNDPAGTCTTHNNIATITQTGDSASKTVKVCSPAKTGALTMGYWKNKNGQAIISGQAATGVCPSATWLRQYAPFQDLSAKAICSKVAAYVYNVINAANASGVSMNAMLKAQMLATALDVYFSNPVLGGNKISASAPIGSVTIDLTKVCKNIARGCTIFENVSSAFGGATSLTVSQMLAYAASQSNAGGSMWYGNVKATQEPAKDAFDAINNQFAFAP